MPNRDGTGPEGKGPRTGRQMGNCEGAEPREITKRFFFGRRLDYENVGQSKVAKKMKISQPTLSRILKSARKKIADALINGQAIRVKGGEYEMVQPRARGLGLGAGRGMGRAGGRGRMGGPAAAGPGGECVCPKCGYRKSHALGQPCYQMKCPKCGTKMTRG